MKDPLGNRKSGLSAPLVQPPRVAIIIPVRNRAALLEKCLASLASQTFPLNQIEVVVCDDASEEDIERVVPQFRPCFHMIQSLRQPQPKGPAAARNLGVSGSTAPYLIFLDSDTLADPSLVETLAAALDENPTRMGAEARIEPTGKEGPLWDSPVCHQGGRFHSAAIAYRREALVASGGFDETFRLPACEDVDLAMRVLEHGPIYFVSKAVVRHPTRRVTFGTHWRWRYYWKYGLILAKRYGFLTFPDSPVGNFPRLAVARAALVTLPAGRLLKAWKSLGRNPKDGLTAALHAIFDTFCGLCALPDIFFSPIPGRPDHFPLERNRHGRKPTFNPRWPSRPFKNKIDQSEPEDRC